MVWTQQFIQDKLATSRKWIEKAILTVYASQTEAEKVYHEAKELNGAGFSSCDSDIMSSFAEWLSGGKDRHLSYKQMEVAKKRMPKYWKQILKAIAAKQREPALF